MLVFAAYVISSAFMTVYHMAVDTVFICASEFVNNVNVFSSELSCGDFLLRAFNESTESL